MTKLKDISIQSAFGVTLHHTYYTDDSRSDRLMILLPGRGYTVDSPLFHYLKQIGRRHQFDMLSICYALHVTTVDNWITRIPDIHSDTREAIAQVPVKEYESVCVVGKSLGTPLAADIANDLQVSKTSALMLTPIQSAMSMLKSVRALGIIGTADPAYDPAMIQETDTQSWLVLDGLNHSLEKPNDWEASLTYLRQVLTRCEAFIAES